MNKENLKSLLKKRSTRFLLLTLLLVVGFTAVGFITYGYLLKGIDDANITFVYSRNIAEGHGFVYNIGGEHVEGSSTMLWTLIISIFYKIFQTPYIPALLLNLGVLTLSISYLAHTLYSTFAKEKTKAIIYVGVFFAWIFAIPTYIVWSTLTLMEFGLYSSILMTILAVLLKVSSNSASKRETYIFYILIASLVLIRPESLLWGIIFIILYFLSSIHATGKFKLSLKKSLIPVGIFAGTYALLIAFRLSYFGYPFPNTYYAKVSSDIFYNLKQGYYYIKNFLDSNSIAFLLVGLAVLLFIIISLKLIYFVKLKQKLTSSEFSLFLITTVILVGLLIPIYNGGDQFPQFRFIQPIWPILILPVFYLNSLINFSNLKINQGRFYFALSIIFISGFLFYIANNINWHKYKEQEIQTLRPQFRLAYDDQLNGENYDKFFSTLNKLPTLGVVAAGAIKLTYNGDVNDLLGLNNVAMAHADPIKVGVKNHAAFNKDVFYAQQPEVMNLIFVNSFTITKGDEADALRNYWNVILKSIYDDDKFKELYSPAVILNKDQNKHLFGVFRKDFIEKLKGFSNYEIQVK